MPWLVVAEEGVPPQTTPLATSPFQIGRKKDNDLVLTDQGVSRENSLIQQQGESWQLVDLDSANGTYLNGRRLQPGTHASLQPGDEIRIGRATIHFFEREPSTGLIGAAREAEGQTTRFTPSPALVRTPDLVRAADQLPLPHRVQFFRVLHELAKHLLEARNLTEIGRAALDLLCGVLMVERAAIALSPPQVGTPPAEGPLVLLVHRTRKDSEEVVISRTISDWVLRKRVAVVTADARHDPRFQRGESIHAYHVRSAMCAPLWWDAGTEGLIYLDNLFDVHAFTEEELELVTAVANQVAIGIRHVRLTKELRDAAIVRANLSRYHSPSVVEMILRESREGKTLGVEVAEDVTSILFADICGFTPLSERLTPAEVADFLNTFYERMTHIIFAFDGSVNKYLGDGVMATFGVPQRLANHASQAVQAALAMQVEAGKMCQLLPDDRQFQIRIGVNTGRVVVGNLGSLERIEFTVVGDVVNVAQRLESVCPPGGVYVGPETHLNTQDLFTYRDLGEIALKGKRQVIRAYEVVS